MAKTSNDLNKVGLLLVNEDVPDPYYGNINSFKKIYHLIDQALKN